MAVMMREALKPNLLQTLENTPVFVHAGPFGNIAHGNSSVVADLIGIHTGDFLVTEAGFGADMGAERFFNIKCRVSGLKPDAAVVVATVRALKSHSGKYKVVAGRPLPRGDAQGEPGGRRARRARTCASSWRTSARTASSRSSRSTRCRRDFASETRRHPRARRVDGRAVGGRHALRRRRPRRHRDRRGGRRGREQAEQLPPPVPVARRRCREKIEAVATKVYGADGVDYTPLASKQLDGYEKNGFGSLPVCIAKTQYWLCHDANLKGAPDRLPPPGPRGPRERRRRLRLPDLRRHAHHARPGEQARRDQHRPRRRRQHRRPLLTPSTLLSSRSATRTSPAIWHEQAMVLRLPVTR